MLRVILTKLFLLLPFRIQSWSSFTLQSNRHNSFSRTYFKSKGNLYEQNKVLSFKRVFVSVRCFVQEAIQPPQVEERAKKEKFL